MSLRELAPLLPLTDVAIFARSTMLDFAGSLAAPLAPINCIVTEVGTRMGDQALNRLQALEDAAAAANTYVRLSDRAARSKIS
jgi:DNA-binding MurR/RpiR family transcriptional regulator